MGVCRGSGRGHPSSTLGASQSFFLGGEVRALRSCHCLGQVPGKGPPKVPEALLGGIQPLFRRAQEQAGRWGCPSQGLLSRPLQVGRGWRRSAPCAVAGPGVCVCVSVCALWGVCLAPPGRGLFPPRSWASQRFSGRGRAGSKGSAGGFEVGTFCMGGGVGGRGALTQE